MCSGGYPLSAPSKRQKKKQKHTSAGLPKSVTQANIPSSLLPPPLFSSYVHTWTQLFCFFLGSEKAREQWTEGERRRHISKRCERPPQTPPPFFFFSHNCPPTFITWKSKQRGRPRPTFMWFGWRRNEREENEKLCLFFPDKDRKICCAGGVTGGVWTEKHRTV